MFDAADTSCPVIVAGSVPRRKTLAGVAAMAASIALALPRRVAAEVPLPRLLRIGGTGMALAAMRWIGDAFTATQPETTVKVLPSLGTGGGLTALTAGAIDIAVSARPLNDAERAKGLQYLPYAKTPLAFVTHPDVGVSGMTLSDVAAILAGQRLTWPSGKIIRLIRREPSDADWLLLQTLSADMAEAARIALARPGLITTVTDQENAESLEQLPGSFGTMTIGQLRSESRLVTPVMLDGEPPTVETIADGRYKLSRTLHAVTHSQPTEEVTQFLAFLATRQTYGLLVRLGHIPLAGTGA